MLQKYGFKYNKNLHADFRAKIKELDASGTHKTQLTISGVIAKLIEGFVKGEFVVKD